MLDNVLWSSYVKTAFREKVLILETLGRIVGI